MEGSWEPMTDQPNCDYLTTLGVLCLTGYGEVTPEKYLTLSPTEVAALPASERRQVMAASVAYAETLDKNEKKQGDAG